MTCGVPCNEDSVPIPEAFKDVNPVPERPDDSEWGKSDLSGDSEDLGARSFNLLDFGE